ncbi:MAG: hypothetical protein ACTSRS_12145 [Candidatus Helarchaeota archaeon]
MGKRLEVELADDAYSKLSQMANENGISIQRMCKHILEEFTHQGKVYSGLWSEGPGKRIIIDFPKYSSKVIKIKETELK